MTRFVSLSHDSRSLSLSQVLVLSTIIRLTPIPSQLSEGGVQRER